MDTIWSVFVFLGQFALGISVALLLPMYIAKVLSSDKKEDQFLGPLLVAVFFIAMVVFMFEGSREQEKPRCPNPAPSTEMVAK